MTYAAINWLTAICSCSHDCPSPPTKFDKRSVLESSKALRDLFLVPRVITDGLSCTKMDHTRALLISVMASSCPPCSVWGGAAWARGSCESSCSRLQQETACCRGCHHKGSPGHAAPAGGPQAGSALALRYMLGLCHTRSHHLLFPVCSMCPEPGSP